MKDGPDRLYNRWHSTDRGNPALNPPPARITVAGRMSSPVMELRASREAGESDGGVGAFDGPEGVVCYVDWSSCD